MKVLVFGGRDYSNYPLLEKALDQLHEQYNFTTVIHGAAKGADSLAGRWAKERNIPVQAFPAQWNTHTHDCPHWCFNNRYCKLAGPRRNTQMLREGQPQLAVGFPGGNGTKDVTQQAKKAGVKTLSVKCRT